MNNMEQILNEMAPCGLRCSLCFAFEGGAIASSAQALIGKLGNFSPYAERFSTLLNEPVFDKYPDFEVFLQYLSVPKCRGCRIDACRFFGRCKVRQCTKDRGIDFCSQCDVFPCSDSGFDEHLEKRWVAMNNRIREIGIDGYYDEIKDTNRYV